MQAVLYFPFINVPPTAWWTRTLLYWDRVGTIVPRSYWHEPERLGDYTLELIREGLVDQFLPEWAGHALGRNFETFLHQLSPNEIDDRRRRLQSSQVVLIHRDKWISYASGLREVRRMGLARPEGDSGYRGRSWVAVEHTTAYEFMAALTLTLCHEVSQGDTHTNRELGPHGTWVPTTDTVEAIQALLTGLQPSKPSGGDRRMKLRVRGELAASELRTELLSDLLPVPAEPLPIEQVLAFRGRHGSLLPNLRRHIESRIDEALAIDDEVLRFRLLDRLRDELEDQITEAETYLRELSLKRVSRSSLLKLLKFIPILKDSIEAGQDLVESTRTNPNFDAEPLAYLAFARTMFAPARHFAPSHAERFPLIEAVSRQ